MPRSIVALLPLALALAVTGCGPKASDAAIAAGEAAALARAAPPPIPTGQDFANRAARSDAFEIEAATLAEAKASSQALKRFAALMIRDHTASSVEMEIAAEKANPLVIPDPTLTDDQNATLARLGSFSGAAFDRSYADQQVAAHEAALSLLTRYAARGDAAPLKAAAGDIRRKVATHLATIEAIDARM